MFLRLEQGSRHYYYSVIANELVWACMVYVHVHKNVWRAAISKSQIAAKLFLHTFKRNYLAPLLKTRNIISKIKTKLLYSCYLQ